MTKLRIIEKQNPDTEVHETLLHVHVPRKKTVLLMVDGMDEELDHLKRTIDNPIPMGEGGDEPLEVRIDDDGTKHLFTNIGGPDLVEVDSEEDLEVLRQTIISPHPYLGDRGVAHS